MELIIYATFLVLSLIAYAARQVANKGEEKKVSVSNINFKRYASGFYFADKENTNCLLSAFRRVSFLYTFSPSLETGCKAPMCINCTPSMASRSPKSPCSMWQDLLRVLYLGLVLGPLLIYGADGRW